MSSRIRLCYFFGRQQYVISLNEKGDVVRPLPLWRHFSLTRSRSSSILRRISSFESPVSDVAGALALQYIEF